MEREATPIPAVATNLKHKVPRTIAGYRLVTKLGQGGMAAVFKAHQVAMDRHVALKVLAPAQVQDRNLRTRFMREARLIGRVQHDNVITCYEVGESDGYLFMALELAEHGDALRLAKSLGGAVPERMAIGLMRDSARGLMAIHRAGLLHRDIKPANIFLTQPTQAKLADMGVAKDIRRLTESDQGISGAHAIIGSPAYMPPEQALGARPDVRSDIYALGASFFQLLTGRLPYLGATAPETLALLMSQPVPDAQALAPHLSPGIGALLRRCLAKDAAGRPKSALEVLEELDPLTARAGASDTLAWPALDRAYDAPSPGLLRCPF
ncbi:MAG TPA: serine/threonine-protein kinase [Planctomycetota bacterium]|nr:serine/threonine-protein kinase [Planctomycetota bacterium]